MVGAVLLIVWRVLVVTLTVNVAPVSGLDLLPFGRKEGDSSLFEDGCWFVNDLVSPTILPPYPFPGCGALYRSIYFTDNGLIMMYNGQVEKHSYPRPTGNTFSDTFSNDRVFIAPFFSDVNASHFSFESNVYYQVYDKSDTSPKVSSMLNMTTEIIPNAHELNFSVDWMLLITWDRVQPSGSFSSTNTFQAVVATDGRHGFTVFNYPPGGMGWDFDVLTNNSSVIGYKCPEGNTTYIQVPDILKRPDSYAGNTGQLGLWVYQLDSNSESYTNPEQECKTWVGTQPDPSSWLTQDIMSEDCPCSVYQAMYDSRYEPLRFSLNATDFPFEKSIAEPWARPEGCFYRRFGQNGSPGSLCCYRNSSEGLRQFPDDVIYGSVVERYSFNPFYLVSDDQLQTQYTTWIEREVVPRYQCCIASTQSDLCANYTSKRPPRNCSSYTPPNLAWCLGNGHFTTLDNADYTFNARGEYVLFSGGSDPNIFARLSYWPNPTLVSNAAYFTSFLLTLQTSDSVEFRLNDNRNGFIVMRNGANKVPAEQVLEGFWVDTCLVKQLNDTHVMFSCPDGSSVTIGVRSGASGLVLSLPRRYKSSPITGLLGNWDDDPSNDFGKGLDGSDQQSGSGPNGTLLDIDFFDFGQTWQLPVALFSYEIDETFDTMNRPITPRPPPEALMQGVVQAAGSQIKETCFNDNVCIFDSVVANSTDFGLVTKQTIDTDYHMQAMLHAFPPVITSDISVLEVYLNETLTVELSALHQGTSPTFTVLINDIQNSSVPNGGFLKLTLKSLDKVHITVTADDGTLSSSVTPVVKLCACSEPDYCNFSELQRDTNILVEKFAVVSCNCPAGRSGPTCEEDFNPCAWDSNLCRSGETCQDRPPPASPSPVTCMSFADENSGHGYECQDSEGPVVTCPQNVKDQSVEWSQLKAVDAVDGPVYEITCQDSEGNSVKTETVFYASTKVTCFANDSSHNQGSCQFSVTIADNSPRSSSFPVWAIVVVLVCPTAGLLVLVIWFWQKKKKRDRRVCFNMKMGKQESKKQSNSQPQQTNETMLSACGKDDST